MRPDHHAQRTPRLAVFADYISGAVLLVWNAKTSSDSLKLVVTMDRLINRSLNQLSLSFVVFLVATLPECRLDAQTFNTLHSFAGGDDGSNPYSDLVLSDNNLYATTSGAFDSTSGTVFSVDRDSTVSETLHIFSGSDGSHPYAGLALSSNVLFGTTSSGGASGDGTLFRVNTDGTGFRIVHTFSALSGSPVATNADGSQPRGGLALSGSTLYGTAEYGGTFGHGTVFAVNSDGGSFMTLHNFDGTDGTGPVGSLILSGYILYGTSCNRVNYGISGTLFKVNTNGTGFAVLHTFPGASGPYARLILSGDTLYGATPGGSQSAPGTVFSLKTDGTEFKTLHAFTGGAGGAHPYGGLVLSADTLYGTTSGGGNSGYGTVFAIKGDGTAFTTLWSFTAFPFSNINGDGAVPYGGLLLSGSTLYGTATGGGSDGYGTVFSISIPVSPPELTITLLGVNVLLTWPSNEIGFTLQSATDLASPVWTNVSPPPTVWSGQNTVTNLISGTQKFFRLSQ